MKKYLKYKQDIQGFGDVAATVKTAQKIAASYIHLLKERVEKARLYLGSLEAVLARLNLFYSPRQNLFLRPGAGAARLALIISSDQGLTGGLYHNLINYFLRQKQKYDLLLPLGRQARQYLAEEGVKTMAENFFLSPLPTAVEVEKLANFIFSLFRAQKLKSVDILYAQNVSLASQVPRLVRFLPFSFADNFSSRPAPPAPLGLPIFEPSKREVFNFLFNKYLKVVFSHYLFEARLAEFAARTVAMEHASSQVDQFIARLKLAYFKQRRKFLTEKQLESFVPHKQLSKLK